MKLKGAARWLTTSAKAHLLPLQLWAKADIISKHNFRFDESFIFPEYFLVLLNFFQFICHNIH